jgi:hypothetical protein
MENLTAAGTLDALDRRLTPRMCHEQAMSCVVD